MLWRCSGVVRGDVLGVLRGCSGGILGEHSHPDTPPEHSRNTPRKTPEHTQNNPQVVVPGEHIGDELVGGTDLAGSKSTGPCHLVNNMIVMFTDAFVGTGRLLKK